MQGAVRSQWLFHWQAPQRRRHAFLSQPSGTVPLRVAGCVARLAKDYGHWLRLAPCHPSRKDIVAFTTTTEIGSKLAMAFIAVESGFDTQATSPKNAQGLMQLIPETAKRFRVKNAYNAEDNIKGGLAYLQWLLAFFKGNVQLVAAAYNAGERTVEKYKGVPPYPETRNYVQKIAMLYKKPSHPFRNDLVKASTILTP